MRQHAKGIVFQSRQVLPDDKPSSDEIQDAVPVKLPKPAEATTSTTAAKTTQKIQQTTTPVTVKPEVLKELKQVEVGCSTSIRMTHTTSTIAELSRNIDTCLLLPVVRQSRARQAVVSLEPPEATAVGSVPNRQIPYRSSTFIPCQITEASCRSALTAW